MRKIINGKLYDTETAVELLDVSRSTRDRGFDYEDTRLYRTAKGAFFIAGEGNARSRWGSSFENGSCAGSGMQLVTDEQAREMVERFGTPELFEQLFGPLEEG